MTCSSKTIIPKNVDVVKQEVKINKIKYCKKIENYDFNSNGFCYKKMKEIKNGLTPIKKSLLSTYFPELNSIYTVPKLSI